MGCTLHIWIVHKTNVIKCMRNKKGLCISFGPTQLLIEASYKLLSVIQFTAISNKYLYNSRFVVINNFHGIEHRKYQHDHMCLSITNATKTIPQESTANNKMQNQNAYIKCQVHLYQIIHFLYIWDRMYNQALYLLWRKQIVA